MKKSRIKKETHNDKGLVVPMLLILPDVIRHLKPQECTSLR